MKYKIADVVFDLKPIYKYVVKICQHYEYYGEEEPAYTLEVTKEMIEREREGLSDFPDCYLEGLAVFRKLCEYVLEKKDGLIFHSSAVAVDGKAYLFTAPSGTGKSTHARLYRELLGDRVMMVNDDKPIIRYDNGDFYVYGTPWNGKHALDTNTRVKIEAICEIRRDKDNSIIKVTPKDMIPVVFNQTLRPQGIEEMDKLIALLDKMLKTVKLYRLNCNMDISSAKLSYSVMSGEKI
ncbi:MAG: hypothetical protein KBS91_02620 [Firmicutes bacterium]|nr:hypothetical protein [Candidatus Caballimonas caccae]